VPLLGYHASMPAPINERQALTASGPRLPAQETGLKPTLPLRANRADQADLVVQDIARSALRKLFQRACIQCHRVITAATLKLLDTKYKVHLRTCRRAGRSA
jgi:mono/diheme cytochrome c family protein